MNDIHETQVDAQAQAESISYRLQHMKWWWWVLWVLAALFIYTGCSHGWAGVLFSLCFVAFIVLVVSMIIRKPLIRPNSPNRKLYNITATVVALILTFIFVPQVRSEPAQSKQSNTGASSSMSRAQSVQQSSRAQSKTHTQQSGEHTQTKTQETKTSEQNTPTTSAHVDGTKTREILKTIPIKGRAPKTGYSRSEFGKAWEDVNNPSCDTRNRILERDLTDTTYKKGGCKVETGTLNDPYTGKTIEFRRGAGTSNAVQIDHVVALSDAWQKGAQQLSFGQRQQFANDPDNLLAVDGQANQQKGDGDAATWLPPNKSYRCVFVSKQVGVKAKYGLWVTQAEHDAIERVLESCPGQGSVVADVSAPVDPKLAPAPAPKPEPKPEPAPKPEPEPEAPAAENRIVHGGSFCNIEGATGYTKKGTLLTCQETTDGRLHWKK